MRSVLWVIAGLLLSASIAALYARDDLLELAHGIAERNDGAELADKLISPEAVLDYMATHPAQVALASWELGQEAGGIYLNSERLQPMAAGAQLLLLATYAEHLAAGEQRAEQPVPLADWQRYQLPGGEDAHQAALHEARALGVLPAASDAGPLARSIPLSGVVRALVRHADPAAADFLFARLGRENIAAVARRAGFEPDALPLPDAGLLQSWWMLPPQPSDLRRGRKARASTQLRAESAAELLARYRALGPDGYADAAWQQLWRLQNDGAFAQALRAQGEGAGERLSLRERAQLAAALPPRAAARACAALLGRIASAHSAGSDSVRAQLQRPIQSEPAHLELEQLGGLSGSQPGVTTSLSYARVRNGGIQVLSVFLRDLPLAVWLRLSSGFLLQRFEQRLLSDEDFYAQARARLTPDRRDARQPIAEPDMHTRAARASAADAIAVTLEHAADR